MLENFEDHEFLNGQNFSKIADVVFTINVPNEDLSSFNIEDYKIITKNTEIIDNTIFLFFILHSLLIFNIFDNQIY